jgi:hypothetical protein
MCSPSNRCRRIRRFALTPKSRPFRTSARRRAMAELATDNLLRVLDGEPAIAAFDLSKV